MRIAIVGVGAIGGYFGARLAHAGEDVVFIARGRHLETLRDSGLRVEGHSGDFAVPEVDLPNKRSLQLRNDVAAPKHSLAACTPAHHAGRAAEPRDGRVRRY